MRSMYENRSGRRTLVIVVVTVLAIAALAAAMVWFIARDDAATGTQASEPSSVLRYEQSNGTAEVAPETSPTGGVGLPQGASRAGGHPVGFPHTDLGAVAVQVAVARGQIGFEYDQAAEIAEVYAAPGDRDVFIERSRDGVELAREQAGVPEQGAVPAPASYAATPIAFTVDKLDVDYYVVNVLCYLTVTTVDGDVEDILYNGTQLVRWIDGDWKLVAGSSAEKNELIDEGQPDAAAPGTKEFAKQGWILIAGAPR